MRGRAVAARVAHNHKVAGSSPAPATKQNAPSRVGFFACCVADSSRKRFDNLHNANICRAKASLPKSKIMAGLARSYSPAPRDQ
jgi:hypothetical protein